MLKIPDLAFLFLNKKKKVNFNKVSGIIMTTDIAAVLIQYQFADLRQ